MNSTVSPRVVSKLVAPTALIFICIVVLAWILASQRTATAGPKVLDAAPGAAAPAETTAQSRPPGAARAQADVEAIAFASLARMAHRASDLKLPDAAAAPAARIVSSTFTTRGEAAKANPEVGAPNEDSPEASRKVWVVRAAGTFLGERVPPGAKPVIGTTGFFVIDDASGEVIGMGMP
jgi:hypothetical protein